MAVIVHPVWASALRELRLMYEARRDKALDLLVRDGRLLEFLDAPSVCVASQVCRAWRGAAGDDDLWERMLERDFGISLAAFKVGCGGRKPREVYADLTKAFRELLTEHRVRIGAFTVSLPLSVMAMASL